MANVNTLVTKAKTKFILDHIFFATLILKMKYVQDDQVGTACTNGKEIRYSGNFFSKLKVDEIVTVFAHEILHCVFAHHTRRGNRDERLWNIACDLAINPLLKQYGFDLPKGALLDPKVENMTAESIYDLINRDAQGMGKYGSNETPADGGNLGTVTDAVGEDGKPATEAEKRYQETDWKLSVTQSANIAGKSGKLPAGLRRLINDHVNPKLPWEELFMRFMDRVSYNDFSWLPPNRKYMNSGLYLPSVRSKELQEITFACDVSGSVMDEELGMIASALNHVADNFRPEMRVLWFDTKVHSTQTFMPGDVIKLEPVGGGGTNFKAPFRWLEDNNIVPNALIIFTDLYCNSYPIEPCYPVMWITWTKNYDKPPFGEVVVI